jgi:hypothetical protein
MLTSLIGCRFPHLYFRKDRRMRPMIEAVESRMMMAGHLPSSAAIAHAASATRVQVTKAKAASAKNLSKIKADLTRLKLTKTQAAIIKAVTTDSAAGYKALTGKINIANIATSGNLHGLLADFLNEAHHPSEAAVARLEADLEAIFSKSGVSLADLISSSAAVAAKVNTDLLQILAAAPNDAKLQTDVNTAIQAQSVAEQQLTAAAQAWLSTSIAAFGQGF